MRYYEELGLLPARGRPEGSHRLYDAEDETRLAELIRVRDLLGLSLAELRDWMDAEAARAVLRERWHGLPAPAVGDRARILAEAMRHVETQVALVRSRRAGPGAARGRAARQAPPDPDAARRVRGAGVNPQAPPSPHYKWIALSNTTLGILMATINSSIVLIALPDIFRGIHLNPLGAGNSSYLLWMIMGFLVATAVLVVSFGRVGDIYGRVRMFTLGFAIFTVFSVLLSVTWMHGGAGALWMIVMRIGQGVGGAFLFANSSAILTDAFPHNQRGLALGVNTVAGIAGSFIGLVLGGVLGPVSWRLVFLVSVPVGLFGTLWSWRKLVDLGVRQPARIDWWGNLTFAAGLIAILVGITYGIQPYGGHTMGWTSPKVLGCMGGGLLLLAIFAVIETRIPDPDVPARAVPDPRVHGREHRHAARLARPRRADVHADHVAAGDLAAAARLQLLADAALGRHLHAAADRRLPDRRAGLGVPLRPLRRPAVRHRRHAGRGALASSCSSCCR